MYSIDVAYDPDPLAARRDEKAFNSEDLRSSHQRMLDGAGMHDVGAAIGAYVLVSLISSGQDWASRLWQAGGLIEDFPFAGEDGSGQGAADDVVFWGSGKRDNTALGVEIGRRSVSRGVRGPLTRDVLGLPPSTPMGDPTLLLPLFHNVSLQVATEDKAICVPHRLDNTSDATLIALTGVDLVVRPAVDFGLVRLREHIDDIASASFVLAGSLYAAMIACAFDRPFAFYADGHTEYPFQWFDFAASLLTEPSFVHTLREGRKSYEVSKKGGMRKPTLSPILNAAPFAVDPEVVLRAAEQDVVHTEISVADRDLREKYQAILKLQTSLLADNDYLQQQVATQGHEIAQLRDKIARRERALSYRIAHLPRSLTRLLRRPFVRVGFHKNGKPRGWLRKLLFSRRKPRPWARQLVFRSDGTPRPAFHDFIYKYNISDRARARQTLMLARSVPPDDAAILICSDMPPMFDQSSGALRLKTLIELVAGKGRPILFCSHFEKRSLPGALGTAEGRTRYEKALYDVGVREILYGRGELERALSRPDVMLSDAFLSFPMVAEAFLPIIRQARPEATVLYDMVDFHAVRMRREAQLKGDADIGAMAEEMQQREVWLANEADITIAISDDEKGELLKLAPLANIQTLPNIFSLPASPPEGPELRKGILFVGGFWHQPNGDAVKWFVESIFPLVRAAHPDTHFTIVGSNPDEEILRLAKKPNVSVLGYVKDLRPLYEAARVCVAPLRYGAGVKGKVGEAMANGLPVVGTSIAVEGMQTESNSHFLQSDTPEGFAAQIVALLDDDVLWRAMQADGRRFIEDRFSVQALSAKVESLFR
ncbi:glycosyltransferase [Kaistia terrae]|uniref:Glycosyltransferase n=1 Tax=Kaistia terrae TaxID=537017 RepID=A0ABW0Q032_9HYPH|nr:glycosyltransferase [Kaistia terrae]MCX5578958.1 glycosyltransferase [Kaistia terrae]